MKTLMTVLVLTFAATSAFAVSVAQCPKAVAVKVTNLNVTKSLKAILNDVEGDTPVVVEAVTTSLKNIAGTSDIVKQFKLSEAKNGKCVYGNGKDLEKVEMYTTKGKDLLYLQTQIGPRGILLRNYVDLEFVDGTPVPKTGRSGMALAVPRYPYTSYSAGGALVFVGNGYLLMRSK